MSDDTESLCEMIQDSFIFPATEQMAQTLPICDNCLFMSAGGPCGWKEDKESCDDFIPHDWKNHILVEGEWWS